MTMLHSRFSKCPKIDLVATLLILSVIAYFKLPEVKEIGDLLWAEDANIFINQAFSNGANALITPYSGYLHLYPRLAAQLVPLIGLQAAPIIFLTAWFIAAIYAAAAIFRGVRGVGAGRLSSFIVTLAIFLQPNNGEVYFNVTNAQWFLAIGLGVYFLFHSKPFLGKADIIILPIIALTGPFSIFLIPFALVKIFLQKNSQEWLWRLGLVALGAAIQFTFILSSNRGSRALDPNVLHWFSALDTFLSFGIFRDTCGAIAIICFVVLWCANKYSSDFRANNFYLNDRVSMSSILLITFGLLTYLASLWSAKQAPQILSPLGDGSRYFILPYACIISGLFGLARNRPVFRNRFLLGFSCLSAFALLFNQFGLPGHIKRESTDFHAFLEYAKIKSDVAIGVNPFWPKYPLKWQINIDGLLVTRSTDFYARNILIQDFSEVNGNIRKEGTSISILSDDTDPSLVFSVTPSCQSYKYLAVNIVMDSAAQGRAQLFWATSSSPGFNRRFSRQRFHPMGSSEINFAIDNIPNVSLVRFDPTNTNSETKISSIKLYCFGRQDD